MFQQPSILWASSRYWICDDARSVESGATCTAGLLGCSMVNHHDHAPYLSGLCPVVNMHANLYANGLCA